jgi:hypothetical protein
MKPHLLTALLIGIGYTSAPIAQSHTSDQSPPADIIKLPPFSVQESRSGQFLLSTKTIEVPRYVGFVSWEGHPSAGNFPEWARYHGRGLKSGDEIYRIEGLLVTEIGVKEAVSLFYRRLQTPGSVAVEVRAKNSQASRKITITRVTDTTPLGTLKKPVPASVPPTPPQPTPASVPNPP